MPPRRKVRVTGSRGKPQDNRKDPGIASDVEKDATEAANNASKVLKTL